ncbi:MAG: FAD-binding oxidoreductase [Balneolaceae bacterium]
MKQTIKSEFIILGAGLAGLMVADELTSRDKKVTLIDINQLGSGASFAPLVLINPATGRRAKMAWKAEECIHAVTEVLERIRDQSKSEFFIKNGVLRPALIEKMSKDFKRSPDKYDWSSADWIQWSEKEELENRFPYLSNTFGGLTISEGFTINTRIFLNDLYKQLIQKGLMSYFNQTYSINTDEEGNHQIRLENGNCIQTEHIIFAVGAGISNFDEWSYLPLERVKGQTLTVEFDKPLPLTHSISSMGYFAYDPKVPNRLVVGSTYEHDFDYEKPDEKGKETLLKKLDKTLPGLSSAISKISQWSGVRVTTQDHQPIIGTHYSQKHLHIITGLGSKGIIYSKYLSKELCDHLLDQTPISPEVNADRFL